MFGQGGGCLFTVVLTSPPFSTDEDEESCVNGIVVVSVRSEGCESHFHAFVLITKKNRVPCIAAANTDSIGPWQPSPFLGFKMTKRVSKIVNFTCNEIAAEN